MIIIVYLLIGFAYAVFEHVAYSKGSPTYKNNTTEFKAIILIILMITWPLFLLFDVVQHFIKFLSRYFNV
jgi:hypothetical protein